MSPVLMQAMAFDIVPIGILSCRETEYEQDVLVALHITERGYKISFPATLEGERALLLSAWKGLAFGIKTKVALGDWVVEITQAGLDCDCGKGLYCPLNPQTRLDSYNNPNAFKPST